MKINTQGFSLIEVLISLLLIAFILFGLDGLQFYSLKLSKSAYFYHAAINQLNNLSERLAALQTDEGFTQQILTWNSENEYALPLGFGTVTGEFPNYIATIYWGQIEHHCLKEQIGETGCLREKIQLALQ